MSHVHALGSNHVCTGAGQEEVCNQERDHGPVSAGRRGQLGEEARSACLLPLAVCMVQQVAKVRTLMCRWQMRPCTLQGYILASVHAT
jgi:hypothetical protein